MNRYGRHGSGAWLRRHKKYQQKHQNISLAAKKLFIPIVVIDVPIPAQQLGRIVIIMEMQPEGSNPTYAVKEYILDERHPSQDAIDKIDWNVDRIVKKNFTDDVKGNPENLPSQQQVKESIRDAASNLIGTLVNSGSIPIIDADHNEDYFITKYCSEYEKLRNQSIADHITPSDTIKQIHDLVLEEKRENPSVEGLEVEVYLIITRTMHILGLNTLLSQKDANRLHLTVKEYSQYYNRNKEVGRVNPNTFPIEEDEDNQK